MKDLDGIIHIQVGYTGGHVIDPTYEEVCSGKTGHVAAVEITFDSKRVSYEMVAKLFFEIHDPTQKGGQGPDLGAHYRSVTFYLTEEQKEILERLVDALKRQGLKVVTEILPATLFYPKDTRNLGPLGPRCIVPLSHRNVLLLDVYTSAFKSWFLTSSAWRQIFGLHSRLAMRQGSFAPDTKIWAVFSSNSQLLNALVYKGR